MTRSKASPRQGARRLFPLFAALIPMLALVVLDLGLRAGGILPPEDPLLLYIRSHGQDFSPLVEEEPGVLTVRRDWLIPGTVNRIVDGVRKGQYFINPGFRPARILLEKPADELRIFVLGGSSAFGLYLHAREAFPSVLESELAALAPDRSLNVVNLGCPGWASDRIANVVDSIVELEPDLVLIYTGHNETLKGQIDTPDTLGAVGRMRALLLQHSSLFAWSNHAVSTLFWSREAQKVRAEAAALEAGKVFLQQPASTPPERRAEFLAAAEPRFRSNIEKIIAVTRARGIGLLLAIPTANILTPPRASEHGSSEVDVREFDLIMDSGAKAVSVGDWARALRAFRRCAELSPEHALAHYRVGLALVALGKGDEAKRELQLALDLDRWTHRMTSRLEDVLVSLAREHDVPLVDVRSRFHRELTGKAFGEYYLDHVHPTARGHAELARQLAPEVASILGLPAENGSDR